MNSGKGVLGEVVVWGVLLGFHRLDQFCLAKAQRALQAALTRYSFDVEVTKFMVNLVDVRRLPAYMSFPELGRPFGGEQEVQTLFGPLTQETWVY